jgi:divalent metal cation (Fe/Co/Zn/Cd) transporter
MKYIFFPSRKYILNSIITIFMNLIGCVVIFELLRNINFALAVAIAILYLSILVILLNENILKLIKMYNSRIGTNFIEQLAWNESTGNATISYKNRLLDKSEIIDTKLSSLKIEVKGNYFELIYSNITLIGLSSKLAKKDYIKFFAHIRLLK